LRRIEKETGVRRETAAGYLRAAGVPVRAPGRWGRPPTAKAAKEVTTDFGGVSTPKPAIYESACAVNDEFGVRSRMIPLH
jgi:hypothetical protein